MKNSVKALMFISAGLIIGWYLHIATEEEIPFSYRTDSIILDTLAAIGLRDYNA